MISRESLVAVAQEAQRAEAEHGPLTDDVTRAYTILGEEFGEVGRALLGIGRSERREEPRMMREWRVAAAEELIQLAATALLLVENLKKGIR